MFQDLLCWFKCLFHDCSCYNKGTDAEWYGNDDSDAGFKRKREAKEKVEAEKRAKIKKAEKKERMKREAKEEAIR